MDALMDVTNGDLLKARQLFDYAAKKITPNDNADERRLANTHNAIVTALRAWCTKACEVQGNGRPVKKLAQAMQVVLTAIASAWER